MRRFSEAIKPLALAAVLFSASLMGGAACASDISLQALKRMIEQTADLNATDATISTPLPQRLALAELGNLTPVRRVLLDVRSNHSDGAHDMDMLARLAEKRGIDTLVFGEHDRYTIRFGLDPMPQLIGVSQEHPSLYESGLPEFFADLEQTRSRHPGLQIMAATESTPGYYWSGVPFVDLALLNAERHIIALGIERPEQVSALPSYDLRNIRGSRNLSLAIWCGFIFVLIIILLRKRNRGVALLLMASFIAFLATWLMQKEIDADVDFINVARGQGLFTIWAHPGTLSGVRDGPMGVKLDTPPYSQRVFTEPSADAFAAVYGDTDNNTLPGGIWDRYMMDYMLGYRSRPLRAVAAGDYHGEGQAGEYLGNYPMDVWTDGTDREATLNALRKGHNNCWQMQRQLNLTMPALYAEDKDGRRILPGDEAKVSTSLRLVVALKQWRTQEAEPAKAITLKGEWIVDGHVAMPVELADDGIAVVTPLTLEPGPHVVRLRIPPQKGVRMEANPFLLRVVRDTQTAP